MQTSSLLRRPNLRAIDASEKKEVTLWTYSDTDSRGTKFGVFVLAVESHETTIDGDVETHHLKGRFVPGSEVSCALIYDNAQLSQQVVFDELPEEPGQAE